MACFCFVCMYWCTAHVVACFCLHVLVYNTCCGVCLFCLHDWCTAHVVACFCLHVLVYNTCCGMFLFCLHVLVYNTCCGVCLFCLLLSCVPCVAGFSGLSIFDCPFGLRYSLTFVFRWFSFFFLHSNPFRKINSRIMLQAQIRKGQKLSIAVGSHCLGNTTY